MANKVGPLIKDARTKAKLSQTALAEQLDGVTAADIGKAERGEKELSQSVLRQIAKLTGVTQSSLLNAAKESTYTSAAKPAAASTAKKTAAASSSKKTAASSKAGTELTAAEKKLVELYRAADSETKKKAVAVLKGEAVDNGDLFSTLLGMAGDILGKK
ncbi:MAG: helix-turn-helix transcriptional regulator [Eubacteriales bacterium]|nr:helix-turn-helix transcriptional regulator [Eubacteriales bacterium]